MAGDGDLHFLEFLAIVCVDRNRWITAYARLVTMEKSLAAAGQMQSSAAPTHDTDYPELHVVFEFFTDNPQKVMPEDVNSPKKDCPYYDPYWEAIRCMQESDDFMEGILLRSVDCNR